MNILDILYRINRWWNTGKVDEVFLFQKTRSEFQYINNLINDKRILSLVGPRRVGKSTLLYQTVDKLIKAGIDPKRILFFSGDEPGLFSGKNTVGDIIEIYIKEIIQENIEKLSSKAYVLIDEIHFLDKWQLYLKSYYDKRYNIKFIISGSSSTHLFHHSKESLLGRIEEIFVLPLDFKQYMEFFAIYKDSSIIEDMPNLDNATHIFDNTEEYYQMLKSKYHYLKEYENSINKMLKEYLLSGGYPEYFENQNILIWQKRLVEDIITKGLYRDIVSIYNIKTPEILEKLMFFVAANQGQAFSFTSIAQTMGVDAVTISSYIAYLSQAFLIGMQENYSTNIGKVIRKNKKLYVIDNGIRNALLRVTNFEPSVEGQLIENCALHNVKLFADKNRYGVLYWRDAQKEVDIVLDRKTNIIPIEIKYRNNVEHNDLKSLNSFMEKFSAPHGIVITKNSLKFQDKIYYIPFWMSSLG